MGDSLMVPCPRCGAGRLLRLGTDGNGRIVERIDDCPCATPGAASSTSAGDEERAARARKTGLCMDCGEPVYGKKGWAIRCEAHRREARLRQGSESANRSTRKRESGRAYRARPDVKQRKNARRRELHRERMASDPAYAAGYRRRRQRETLFNYPHREKYLETQRRLNADPERREAKRARARKRYYELRPVRPVPVCRTCDNPIEWHGHGRPPVYCATPDCHPDYGRLARRRAASAFWNTHAAAAKEPVHA